MRKSDKYVEENGMESQLCIIFMKLKFVGVLPTGRYSRPGSGRLLTRGCPVHVTEGGGSLPAHACFTKHL